MRVNRTLRDWLGAARQPESARSTFSANEAATGASGLPFDSAMAALRRRVQVVQIVMGVVDAHLADNDVMIPERPHVGASQNSRGG
jgi:hypothetical protein